MMSAQATTARPFRDKEAEFAFYRRRDHANLENLQNLAIAEIARRAAAAYAVEYPDEENPPCFEMPPKARYLISALQGAHGGGFEEFEPFERGYRNIGEQLQFTGSDSAIESRVRRWLNELLAWQRLVGYELFSVVRGGEVIGYTPHGDPIHKRTTFIDYLKPYADAGVKQARLSEQWRGNAAKKLKPHPGLALAAQVDYVVAQLPRLTPTDAGPESHTGKESKPLPLDEYEKRQEEWLEQWATARADRIEQRGGSGHEWLEQLANQMHRWAASIRRTQRARRNDASHSIFDDEPATEQPVSNNRNGFAYKGHTPGVSADETKADAAGGEGTIFSTLPPDEVQPNQQDSEPQNVNPAPQPPSCLDWALYFAMRENIPVGPVYGVADGVCDCPVGSECRTPGKHPIPRHGVKEFTTDPEQIRRWFTEHPTANLGGAMGGHRRLLGFDIDPRNGGSASMYDLVAAHGDEWTQTRRHRTGSGGFHLLFTVPEGVEFRRGKIAPGIDLKWAGGLLVLPPSDHASGRKYEIDNLEDIATAPAWLTEELTRPEDQPPARLIDFQEERGRRLRTGPRFFDEGERNNGLRDVMCGRWVHGWAVDA